MTVYKPADDSYLLRDHIRELDLDGKKVLDMGTGSGIIAIEAAKSGAKVVAADINQEAIDFARVKKPKTGFGWRDKFVQSNLF